MKIASGVQSVTSRRVSGKVRVVRSVVCVVLTVGVLVGGYQVFSRIGTATPEGVWADDSGFSIRFLPDGTYIDSVNAIRCPYKLGDGQVTFLTVDGTETLTTLTKNYGQRVSVLFGGVEHTMRPQVDTSVQSTLHQCIDVFKLKQAFESQQSFTLYSDGTFDLIEDGEISISGTVVYHGPNQIDLMDGVSGEAVLTLTRVGEYYVAGELVTGFDTESVRVNAVGDSTIKLEGYADYFETGASYEFSANNTAVLLTSTGQEIPMIYSVDAEGLVTLVDIAGTHQRDYLFYSKEWDKLYRYVFARDTWKDYLVEGGGIQ